MKHNFNEIWKSKEGTKTVWKVQATNGILTFARKQDALVWAKSIEKLNIKEA